MSGVVGPKARLRWQAELWAEQQDAWTIAGALASNGAVYFALTFVMFDPAEVKRSNPNGEYWQWRVIAPEVAESVRAHPSTVGAS